MRSVRGGRGTGLSESRRGRWLTPGEVEMLRMLARSEQELVRFGDGCGWWLGDRQANPEIAEGLLVHSLIEPMTASPGGGRTAYRLSAEGSRAATDPDYEPTAPVN